MEKTSEEVIRVFTHLLLFYYSNTHLKSHNNDPCKEDDRVDSAGEKDKSTIDPLIFKNALAVVSIN